MPSTPEPAVTVTMQIVTDEKARDRTLETFRSLVGQIRGRPGCIDCQLLEDVQDPGNLIFRHGWGSERALRRFARSPGFQSLLAGIDLASQAPRVRVQTATGVRGMDFFEEQLATPED